MNFENIHLGGEEEAIEDENIFHAAGLVAQDRRFVLRMNEQQRGGLRNLRFKPPIFSGKKSQNIKQFFSKLEKYLNFYGVEEDRKIEATGLCFEDDALEHFDSFCRAHGNATYDEIKEAMIDRYNQDKIPIAIRSGIRKRCLETNESVTDYFNFLQQEAN